MHEFGARCNRFGWVIYCGRLTNMATKSKQNPAPTSSATSNQDDANSFDVSRPSFFQSSSGPGLDAPVSQTTKQKLLEKLQRRSRITEEGQNVFAVDQHPDRILPAAKKPKTTKSCYVEDPKCLNNNLAMISEALLSASRGRLAIRRVANCLVVTRAFPDIEDVAKGGPFFAARVVIEIDGKATFQVLSEPKWSTCLIKSVGSVLQEEVEAVSNCFI